MVANGSIACPRYWKGPASGAFFFIWQVAARSTFAQFLPACSLHPPKGAPSLKARDTSLVRRMFDTGGICI